ncbi:MAG TPA: NYN domain-containing protein [Thermoanaerobaculia bacterium]|jgi:predicted RNA-binding protein with PIN domain
MPFLIDGSNLLGVMKVDRRSDESKRKLVTLLASFARAKKTRVTCVFDGPEPPSFARHLGAVTIAFSGHRSADDIIVERAANGRGWSVVTQDRHLAARVARRHVEIVTPTAFIRDMEASASSEENVDDDWMAFFDDPKNRIDF